MRFSARTRCLAEVEMPRIGFEKRVKHLEKLLPKNARQETFVTLPSGRKISLVEARERLVERDAWLGLPKEIMRQRLEKQQHEFNLLKQAAEMRRRGISFEAIGKVLELKPETVKSWLGAKKQIPRALSRKRFALFERKRTKISIQKENYPEFAYVLGGFFGNVFKVREYTGMGETKIELQTVDKEFAQEFEKNFNASIKVKREFRSALKKGLSSGVIIPKQGMRRKLYSMRVVSSNLVQLFNKITDYKRHVPVDFLSTRESRTNFLKALFDSRGRIQITASAKTPYIEFHTTNAELLNFVSVALLEREIQHTMHRRREKFAIRIGSAGVPVFRQEIGFRAEQKQKALLPRQ